MNNSLSSITLEKYPLCNVEDEKLKWAVIVSRYQQQWLLVKHKQRDTLESPGGKRELGETILACAERELFEETGAINFTLSFVASYSIKLANGELSYGQLFFAEIHQLESLPDSEIERICLVDQIPDNHTYPAVHPFLIEKIKQQFLID